MTRIAMALLLASALAGCKGEVKKADFEDSWISEQAARKTLDTLQQVQAWKQQLARQGGQIKPVVVLDRGPAECKAAGEQPGWAFALSAVSGTGTTPWQRLQVDAAGGEITIWSQRQKRYMPVEMWRP